MESRWVGGGCGGGGGVWGGGKGRNRKKAETARPEGHTAEVSAGEKAAIHYLQQLRRWMGQPAEEEAGRPKGPTGEEAEEKPGGEEAEEEAGTDGVESHTAEEAAGGQMRRQKKQRRQTGLRATQQRKQLEAEGDRKRSGYRRA